MLNKPRCQLCRRNHPLKYCVIFRNMSPSQRRAHAIQHDYCLNCFAQCHTRYWCESKNRCRECGYKHHSMLHEEGWQVAKDSSSYEEGVTPIETIRATPSAASGRLLIPPLLLVKIMYQGAHTFATFLLQSSTNHSFLLKETALNFDNFPSKGSASSKGKETFQVSPSHVGGQAVYTWELEIRDNATFSLPPPIADSSLQRHFESLHPQAHPQFATCRKVDGVIGYPLMTKFLKREYERKEPTLPRAQNSKFGWIVHGEWKGCGCHS